jgi:acyl dehydratase
LSDPKRKGRGVVAMDLDRSSVGMEFDRTVLDPVSEEEIREYASFTGEPVNTDDSDKVVAPPSFVLRMRGKRFMPRNLPDLGRSGFDAGKDMQLGVPVRPGDVLTSVSTVHDLYEKTGRSGRMAFIVLRSTITNQKGEQVAIIDQRMMFR